MLTNSKNGVSVSVRDNKRYVDISLGRFSAFVDMAFKRVRGRPTEIRHIAAHITQRDEVSDVFSRKVVIEYAINRVNPPALDVMAVGEVLRSHPDFIKLETIMDILHTDNAQGVLQALRILYKRRQCSYYRVDENIHYFRWGNNNELRQLETCRS